MSSLLCIQCRQRPSARRTGIAFMCRSGWLHYNPQLCKSCFATFEATVEAHSPTPAWKQSGLPFTYAPEAGA